MVNYYWFRRDLRLEDNCALYHALNSGLPVQAIFIFDQNILSKLQNPEDARVSFIYAQIETLSKKLEKYGASLRVYYGKPLDIWQELIQSEKINTLYLNHDYENYAIHRDQEIKALLEQSEIQFKSFKDHVIYEKLEVAKDDGKPYTVFTPYKRKWLAKLESEKAAAFKPFPSETLLSKNTLKQTPPSKLPELIAMGFKFSNLEIPSKDLNQGVIRKYDQQRDFPAIAGTSRLGIHFRFGTISIRRKAQKATTLNQVYLSELIWRDFYAQILANFPAVDQSCFRPQYEQIEWRNNEQEFDHWCKGSTGYPIVDAGMREINATGHMHNRVRMITASFLTKHLLIDWRWGAQYFADRLLDYDLASNVGGWQWAAGCGTDAAPYFRIFNPYLQQKKFDPKIEYIKKWIPEYGTDAYPEPIVDHKEARVRCLDTYKRGLGKL